MTYYFQTCCAKSNNSDNYFGLSNYVGDTLYPNEIYSIVTPVFKACGTMISGTIPSNSDIYDGSNAVLTNYDNCTTCIGSDNSFSCSPSPTVNSYTLSNEGNSISIFPMGVICDANDTRDPSYYGAIDGKVSVKISGGTPPYTTTWWSGIDDKRGSVSASIQGLPAGSYTATTTDFWPDYTAITICTLTNPPEVLITPISEYSPPNRL
jgi:hypothetical protein